MGFCGFKFSIGLNILIVKVLGSKKKSDGRKNISPQSFPSSSSVIPNAHAQAQLLAEEKMGHSGKPPLRAHSKVPVYVEAKG
jgi:hypothetical protein